MTIIYVFIVQYRILFAVLYVFLFFLIKYSLFDILYRTYFHRELSEDDKRLIGDTTPKPIKVGQTIGQSSPSGVVSPSNSTKKTNIIESQSQWNAGIYIIVKFYR